MWVFPWLRNRTSKGSLGWSPGFSRLKPGLQQRPTAQRFRPRLEVLEGRWLPTHFGLTVSSLADSGPGTLRAAILAADAGSPSDEFTIGFRVTGTIDLQSPLPDLNNSITIRGPGASSLTVERAAGVHFNGGAVVNVKLDTGESASISGLTIANGEFSGIVNFGGGILTVANCAVVNNSHPFAGGGINNVGTMTINGCIISGNTAAVGGGISNFGTLTITGSKLSGNTATLGGGIGNAFQGTLTVSDCTLSGNSADLGGGIFSDGAPTTVRDSVFTGNSATQGGGIYFGAAPGLLEVEGSTFTDKNTASDSGGGIYNLGTATVQECHLSGNTAGSAGGGIFNGASGTLTVKDSTVLHNVAPLGADLYNLGALTLDDSTVGVIGP
jgi:hypothetical protein